MQSTPSHLMGLAFDQATTNVPVELLSYWVEWPGPNRKWGSTKKRDEYSRWFVDPRSLAWLLAQKAASCS